MLIQNHILESLRNKNQRLKFFDNFDQKYKKSNFQNILDDHFGNDFLSFLKSVFGDSQNHKMNTSELRRSSLKNKDTSALPPIGGSRPSMMDFISEQDPRSSKKTKFEPNLPNMTRARSDSIPRRRSTGKLFGITYSISKIKK